MKRYLLIVFYLISVLSACQPVEEIEFYLNGDETVYHSLHLPYTDVGYTLLAEDDTLSPFMNGYVDVNTPGEYYITYSLEHNGDTITLSRTIIVENKLIQYFNQTPPTTTPIPFAIDIITTDVYSEFAGTFSPDYRFYFFTRRNEYNDNRILYSAFIDEQWTTPALSPISHDISEMEPYITPNGLSLYFSSKRDGNTNTAIFRSDYRNNQWQEAIFVDTGLNDTFAMYISVADSGNLYYTTMDSKIYMMEYWDGVYQDPIFTGIDGAHSFIAPDESFMLVDDSNLGNPYTSIYISIQTNGVWEEPIKLDDTINVSGYNNICPSISPDGEYLFFSRFRSGNADIYWVSMDILKPYIESS